MSTSVVCGLLFVLCIFNIVNSDVIVNTAYGQVRGIRTEKSLKFLGIPFATPPVGNLRWRSPSSPKPWQPDVYNATTRALSCPQKYCDKYMPGLSCPNTTSEDCLYLNIWTPLNATNNVTSYPVMVFLHGGAFKWGFASALVYDGNNIASYGQVILVTVDYRLGVLGYLYTGEGEDDSHGNYGVQDQRLGLQWVQQNIQYFGGDPSKVTIFGQSAGAQSVAIHMTSPKSHGLFRSAIIESAPLAIPYRDKEDALKLADDIRKLLKCPEKDMACMRSRTTEQVNEAQQKSFLKITTDQIVEYFEPIGPIVDDIDISVQPMTAAVKGLYGNIPVMVGTVTEEGRLFVYGADKIKLGRPEYEAAIIGIHPDHFEEMRKFYMASIPSNVTDYRDSLSQFITDYLFTCATRNASKNIIMNGNNNVYRYEFDHAPVGHGGWGIDSFCDDHVCHAVELSYVFGTNPAHRKILPVENILSASIMAYWTNFAHSSNPNIGPNPSTIKWPTYMSTNTSLLHFVTPQVQVIQNYRQDFCNFWDSLGFVV